MAGIFSPWTQLRDEDERVRGGFGLGLAVVRSLAELLGGKVKLESGARPWQRVPLVGAAESPAPGGAPTSCEIPQSGARPLRILVVDDVEINRQFLRKILETDGHRVDEAAEGASAVQLVRETPYDVLLLDCFLEGADGTEGIDGFEVARRVREYEGGSADGYRSSR